MMFFDTHCHLDMDRFDEDRDAVIARAADAGLVGIVTVGVNLVSSARAIALAGAHEFIHAGAGVHPTDCHEAPGDWESQLRALAADERVVAIGETGLDFHWDRAPVALQREFLRRHLVLAREFDKPIILHTREATAATLDEVEADAETHGAPLRGILHCFSGTASDVQRGEALGLMISFGGNVTFKKSGDLRESLAAVSESRLLIETDAPFLAPQVRRGRRNEPALVAEVATVVAEVRTLSLADAGRITTQNAARLFGLPAGAALP